MIDSSGRTEFFARGRPGGFTAQFKVPNSSSHASKEKPAMTPKKIKHLSAALTESLLHRFRISTNHQRLRPDRVRRPWPFVRPRLLPGHGGSLILSRISPASSSPPKALPQPGCGLVVRPRRLTIREMNLSLRAVRSAHCTFSGNRAEQVSGAIDHYDVGSGSVVVINSTLSDNHAASLGGGLYGPATLLNTKFQQSESLSAPFTDPGIPQMTDSIGQTEFTDFGPPPARRFYRAFQSP